MEDQKPCKKCADSAETSVEPTDSGCDSKPAAERPKIPDSIARILARGFT